MNSETKSVETKFKNRLDIIDIKIINGKNNKKILNDYHNLKKEIFEADILSKENEYGDLLKKIEIIDDYILFKASINQEKNLDFLTIINLICLPIGLILAYFSMNFSGLGNPNIKKGILSINNPNLFVFSLIIFTVLLLLSILHFHDIL